MMRVAYVCADPGVPVLGHKGASAHVQAVVHALLRLGAQVEVVTGAPVDGADRLGDAPLHVLPRAATDGTKLSKTPAARELRRMQADAYVATVLSRLAARAPLDLVYERYSLWGRTAMRWAAEHRVPSLLEVNAPLVEEQRQHRVLVDHRCAEQVAYEAISTAGAVLCVSGAVARWARRHAADPSRVHVLNNGVDCQRVHPSDRPQAPASSTPFTVGFVGTLKPWHDVDTLRDAFTLLAHRDASYRLLVVGDGPGSTVLRNRLAADRLLDRADLTGAVDTSAVPALLRRMDVAVAPYPAMADFYFSPLKVYEYLAAGLPVVASRVGDLPEVLDHGRLGVLVEPGDAAALAGAVAALRTDPDRRRRLALDGRVRAVERHDWVGIVATALTLARTGRTTIGGAREVHRVAPV